MSPARPHDKFVPLVAARRLLAGLLAVFVFALGMAAQSPSLHAWLHELGAPASSTDGCDHAASSPADPHSDTELGCAVALIAQGLTVPLTAPTVAGPCLPALDCAPVIRDHLPPAAPARLHPPAQAPPHRA